MKTTKQNRLLLWACMALVFTCTPSTYAQKGLTLGSEKTANTTSSKSVTLPVQRTRVDTKSSLSQAVAAQGNGILGDDDLVASPITQSHGQPIDPESLVYDPENLKAFLDAQVESLRYIGVMNDSNLPVDLTIEGSDVKVGEKLITRRYDRGEKGKRVPNMKPIFETYYADVFVPVSGTGSKTRTIKDPNNPYGGKIVIPGKPPKMKRKKVRQKRIIGWKQRGFKC